jgi:MFS family permease
MQAVGAQWLLVDAPNAAALVALVQAASTLPVMLLALPGGVLADSFDRRWLLFTVQVYFFGVGVLLAVLTAVGQMPPAMLLMFTFALGVGTAVQLPAWGASVPELVPRAQLRAASRLELVSVNVSRAIGPALAGIVIAHLGGVPVVFALNALSVVALAAALLFWRRPPSALDVRRERFVPALRAGGRYAWHEPVVRRILLRATMFIAPAMALWTLLPLIASRHLGLEADGFGIMFAALGVGAVLGAQVLGRLRGRLSTNGVLATAGALYAAALAALVEVTSFPAALAALVVAGLAWMAVTSTLQAASSGPRPPGHSCGGWWPRKPACGPRFSWPRSRCWPRPSPASSGGFPRPASWTPSPRSTGPRRDWPSTPSPTPVPFWSRSTTRWRRNGSRPSSMPWAACGSPDAGPAPPDGSSTATGSSPTGSWRCSPSRRGRSTCASTTAG